MTRPRPPSEVVETPIPADLEEIVLQCLEKRPEDRPASAADLCARLGEVACVGEWTEARAKAWRSRHAPDVLRPSARTDDARVRTDS